MTAITSERKYLFDAHNFDLPDEPEVDPEAPPPPPVFSLEEISLARDEGFAQGRLAGLEEAAASREQYIASQLEKLAQEFRGILLAEQRREKLYETEVLTLCEAIFAKAFPELNRQYGMSEVLAVIRSVITTQQDIPKLVIDVPQGEMGEIVAALEKLPEYDSARIHLRESPEIGRGSCRMSWQDGGALRNHAEIAARIAAELTSPQQSLAPEEQKDDNSPAPDEQTGEE